MDILKSFALEHLSALIVIACWAALYFAGKRGKRAEAEAALLALLSAVRVAESRLLDAGKIESPELVKEVVISEAANKTKLTAEQLSSLVEITPNGGVHVDQIGALTALVQSGDGKKVIRKISKWFKKVF